MARIHMILQGKGGVGKTMVAATLAQYLAHTGNTPLCIDTDPVNSTLKGYRGLNVHRLNILKNNEIHPRRFDDLIELVAQTTQDVIIDNGASSFVPLSHYLISNDVCPLLEHLGHELVIHTLITGGQAMVDTISGFAQLVGQFPTQAQFVVWLNPFWGAIEYEGKDFRSMKVYNDYQSRIAAMVDIPQLKAETYGRDFSDLLQQRMTFTEALNNTSLGIMTRQRLKMIRSQLFPCAAKYGGVVMDDDALDEVIRDVASQHGIALGRDDPILIWQTLHRHLLKRSEAQQQAFLQQLEKTLQGSAVLWQHEAKELAQRSLAVALTQSHRAIDNMVEVQTRTANGVWQGRMREIEKTLALISGQARWLSIINLCSSSMTLLLFVVWLYLKAVR